MYGINLKNIDSRGLIQLQHQIEQEAKLRLKGEQVVVWKVEVNGGTSWYKDYDLFSKEIKELAEDYTEQDDMKIVIDKQLKPKTEVDTWIGDYCYEE